MARIFSVLALFTVIPTTAAAQDMPLSQILIDGQGWKKVDAPGAKPRTGPPHTTPSADGGTAFVGSANQQFLLACPLVEGYVHFTRGAPYAELRTRRGEKGIDVTGLSTDKDGRIYAATDIGVQVFDPTGRLCGVLTPAASGKPEAMTFEGNNLTLWIGETKYARKLNAQGVK
jgi:hypothetical protein